MTACAPCWQAVAGGAPVIDVLASTSLWAAGLLKTLAQVHPPLTSPRPDVPPCVPTACSTPPVAAPRAPEPSLVHHAQDKGYRALVALGVGAIGGVAVAGWTSDDGTFAQNVAEAHFAPVRRPPLVPLTLPAQGQPYGPAVHAAFNAPQRPFVPLAAPEESGDRPSLNTSLCLPRCEQMQSVIIVPHDRCVIHYWLQAHRRMHGRALVSSHWHMCSQLHVEAGDSLCAEHDVAVLL